MREIRFRSWNGRNKEFMYATVERPFDDNFPILYLSSGLKDANGKEIFAGDIVELVNGEEKISSVVKFVHGCFMIHQINSLDSWTELWRYMKNWRVEIVGNVMEEST